MGFRAAACSIYFCFCILIGYIIPSASEVWRWKLYSLINQCFCCINVIVESGIGWVLFSAVVRAICVRLLFQSVLSFGFVGLALLSGSLSKQPGIHPSVSSADTPEYLALNQILKSSLIHMLWWHKEFQLPGAIWRGRLDHFSHVNNSTLGEIWCILSLPLWLSCGSLNTVPPTTQLNPNFIFPFIYKAFGPSWMQHLPNWEYKVNITDSCCYFGQWWWKTTL